MSGLSAEPINKPVTSSWGNVSSHTPWRRKMISKFVFLFLFVFRLINDPTSIYLFMYLIIFWFVLFTRKSYRAFVGEETSPVLMKVLSHPGHPKSCIVGTGMVVDHRKSQRPVIQRLLVQFPWSAWPDVLISTLHGSHHHQCVNVCMIFCDLLWTQASAKCKSNLMRFSSRLRGFFSSN